MDMHDFGRVSTSALFDRERHEGAATDHKPAELSALVARVAATGAIRAVFQPIYDLDTGAPRGFEGLVRPLPNSGFNDPGTMFAAAEATGRTAELDIACLNKTNRGTKHDASTQNSAYDE